ncbi:MULTISPECIES: copper resistance CopC family protein [Pseudonocardia]|uniref:copper resistance CopC family protein n=1 Tax=Pseudonocardia TaxID=1847 RepID=UPI000A2846C7|nr:MULTISPECIES: copper resistance CopC family protein [Pseudonocardia]
MIPVPSPIRRVTLVLPVVLVALLLGAAPAWAHTELESSTPAENAEVAQAPSEISLTFSEDVSAGTAEITVRGPDGADRVGGPATEDAGTLTVPLEPLGVAGTYTIEYRVVSDDGHPVAGTVPFTLTRPGPAGAAANSAPAPSAVPPATPAPAAAEGADDGAGGAPVWPWVLLAVVVLGGGVALALRRRPG